MKTPPKAFIPVLSPTWSSQSSLGQVNFENGGASLPGGIYQPRYMLVHPLLYEIVTVGMKSSEEVKGYDWLYVRAGGLKADIIPMDGPFSILFFKKDASSTRALYERYCWDAPHQEFIEHLRELQFPIDSTVDDIKTLLKQKLGDAFKKGTKS